MLVCKNLPRIIVGRELLCGRGLARQDAHESRRETAPAARAQLAAEVVAARADRTRRARGRRRTTRDERQHVGVSEDVDEVDAPEEYVCECRTRPIASSCRRDEVYPEWMVLVARHFMIFRPRLAVYRW